ncbi:MAG: squalene/phytoene synthase family protein [Pseudomonadota bacterium]
MSAFAATVRAADRTAYLATLFAPEVARPALLALAAYGLELTRIVTRANDPVAAEIRLQWWRDAIRNEGFGEGAGVPLVTALREAANRFAWPLDTLCTISEGRIHDLYADPFADFDAFDGYAGEVFGAPLQLGAMAVSIARLGEASGLAAARTAASAAGYGGVVLCTQDALHGEAARLLVGRTHGPQTAWQSAGVADLPARLNAGAGAPPPLAALRDHGQRAADAFWRAADATAPEARSALILAGAATRGLSRCAPPGPFRAQLRLWRAARQLRPL